MQWVHWVHASAAAGTDACMCSGKCQASANGPIGICALCRQLNLSGADDSTAPAEPERPGLPNPPPPLTPSLYQSQQRPQSESNTGGHTARTGHYCGALQSELHAGRPPLSVNRPQPRRLSSSPLSFSSRPGFPNRRMRGVKKAPWISRNT